MLHRFIALTLTTVLVLGSPLALVPASAQGQGGGSNITNLTIPIVGTVTAPFAGTFNGAAAITNFAVNSAGQLVARGTLTGLITNTATGVVTSFASTFEAPVTGNQASAACDILSLLLGPIHLDILGLVVDTNQIVIGITAVPGAGHLLGNLLCGVAGLLDSGGSLTRVAALLNQILRSLPL
jgi:hypothetical protein